MKRTASVCLLLFVLFQVSFSANAADTKIYSENVSAKSNRLFEVNIDIKSPKILTAAAFTLTYNPSAAAFRNAVSSISNAQVKEVGNNGTAKVIFLVPNGVKINNKSTIVSVKFKALQSGSSEINITPSDFVDDNAKNFKAPSSVKCKVITDGKTTPIKNTKSRRAEKSAAARNGGKSVSGGEVDVPEGDADADGLSPEKDGLVSAFDSTLNGSDSSPRIIILIVVCAVLTAAGLVFILKKTKDDKNNKDK